jgi:CHAT domain-containing protein
MVTPEHYVCDDRDMAGAPLHKTRSVVAAACLTSATSPAVNEYSGMGAAFLQAGVGTFIGTIYPLSDAGSSRLVPELYRLHLREGLSWADALRRAQWHRAGGVASGASQAARQATMSEAELERLEGYLIPASHPYHWAAFTISGKE